MYCIYCGFKNKENANFCNKCGKKINKIDETKITSFINDTFPKITGANNYKKRIGELEKTIDNIHNSKINIESKELEKLVIMNQKLKEENIKLSENIENSKEILQSLESLILDEEYNLFKYDDISSEDCKNKLSILKIDEKELIKNDKAIIPYSKNYLNIPRKSFENNKKQLIKLFNSECELIISNVSITNIEQSRTKLNKTFELNNKIFETDYIQLSKDFLRLKLEELTLLYNYQKKKKEEQELQKEIRHQMLEEEKVRKEIEKEKQRLEKEEKQFNAEVHKLMKYMQNSENDIEKQLYIDKIKELEDKIKLLSEEKEKVIDREKNTRAGFVYIISNIGSFGDNVYKIGMTRRLEPMDRIKELGDASVPFEFDVHAMIFSEDAPALESLLHKHFEKNRVNKVNPRKEFYKVDLKDIEKLVKEKFNPTTEFIMLSKAEEYNQSKNEKI